MMPTKAQMSLARLVRVYSPRAINRKDAQRRGLLDDFNRAKRAGLITTAHYECTVVGDEWLESVEGREVLTRPERQEDGK